MDYKKEYEKWLNDDFFSEEIRSELAAITDEKEIEDRFHSMIVFGTAGLRGKLGAGLNRMNDYTVSLATQGLADTISSYGEEAKARGVAIAYDVRHRSKEFAELTAEVLAANGIKVYIYNRIMPTPVLSFTIRKLNTISGVMLTASHNPRDYNGYKAYWQDGSQIVDEIADEISKNIEKVENFRNIKRMDFASGQELGLIEYVPEVVYENYIQNVLAYALTENIDKDVCVVYTPLNGTGNVPVREVLQKRGFHNIHVVEEQENPDPDFTTVGYPNPEDPKAFAYAIKKGKEVGADLLLATDPDCDRAAIMVRDHRGEYVFLNGNKIGALLIQYVLSQLTLQERMPKGPMVVKSIVTGDFGKVIAKKYGVKMIETLTGFKNICDIANQFEDDPLNNFVFGYEESIGYVYGTTVRDKDAVNASMLIVEMAAYYKKNKKRLLEVLFDLYDEFGFYSENLISIVLEGLDGQARIKRIMTEFRENPLKEIGETTLTETIDYLIDDTGLQKANVLKYYYDDESWFALRPSGTEPKIKLYVYGVGATADDSMKKINRIEALAKAKIESIK